jgi:HEAT repeat protein
MSGRQDPTAAEQQSEAVVNRIGYLLGSLSRLSPETESRHAQFSSAFSDVSVYGAAAVPWLESLLEPRAVQIGDNKISMDTKMAARLLSELDAGVGSEALGRALSSQDPLIRRAVADHMSAEKHRALLERAAEDPVPQVRTAAIAKLLWLDDPALQPLAEREALRGVYKAVQWLAQNASERLLDLTASPDAGEGILNYSFQVLGQAGTLPPTQRAAGELLRLARELPEAYQRSSAIDALLVLLDKPWDGAPDSLRAFVQEQALNGPERYDEPGIYAVLGKVGDVRALEFLAGEYAREQEGRPQHTQSVLFNSFKGALQRTRPGDFDALARLYRETPLPAGSASDRLPRGEFHEHVLDQLIELAKQDSISASTLARGYEGLEGLLKARYNFVARAWFKSHPPIVSSDSVWSIPANSLDAVLIPVIRDFISDPSSTYQGLGIHASFAAGDIDSLPSILGLIGSSEANVGNEADATAHRFADTDPRRASELILEAIRSGADPDSIRFLDPPYDLELFKTLWAQSEDAGARSDLLRALVDHLSGKEADALIVEHYHEIPESDSGTRHGAIARFGEHLYEPSIPILGNALEDPDVGVRIQARKAFQAFKQHREALEEFAAWTLGDRQARAQIDELEALLESPDNQVVIGAVKALGVVRARSALPALVRLLERDDGAVRSAVHEAIERIGQ